MQSIDLGMNDVFDRGGGYESGEDIGFEARNLNEGDVNGDRNDEPTAEGDEVLSNLKDVSKEVTKKRVSRPQIKLDVDRLKSSRGLPALPKIFEKVTLKGKGHEAHDLDQIMTHLEHWAHRLMPKMPFYEFVERMEKLGTKKEVQTCLKRIRLDMPFLDSNVNDNDYDDKPQSPMNTDTNYNNDDESLEIGDDHNDNNYNEFDSSNKTNNTSNQMNENDSTNNNNDGNSISTAPATISETTDNSTNKSVLSESIKERIERNRQLALQRRAMRMGGGGGLNVL